MTPPRRTAPADPVLPALAALVDESAVSAALQPVLTLWNRKPCRIRRVEIERIKYRPGRNCVVAYRFALEFPGQPGIVEQRASLSMHERGEAASRHEKARSESIGDGRPCPVQFLPAWNAIARAFPSDRKLVRLERLATPDEALSRYLRPLVATRWPGGATVRSADHSVVSYFPDHTCTVALTAGIDHGTTGRVEPWRAFGKMRYDDAGAHTHRVMQTLWNSDAQWQGLVGYARPLGYDADDRLLWQEGVQAPTLHSLLATERAGADTMRRVARAVAALHGTRNVASRNEPREFLADAVANAAAVVARAAPEHATAALRLADALTARAGSIGSACDATLHGDLHSRNILVGADRVHLIDMDRVSTGDALSELGSLLAELAYRACVRGERPDAAALAQVVDGYFGGRARADAAETLAWHLAAALLHERARRAVTSLKPGWREALPAVLDAAYRALNDPGVLCPGESVEAYA